MSLDRRSFARGLSLSGLAYLGFRLTGCGPISSDSRIADDGTVNAGASVTMYDLRMEAWSTLGSGQLGFTGTLTAVQIKDAQDLTLPYTQDPDGHHFTLSHDDFKKLRRGEAVSVITTIALNHNHEVRINPVTNRIPGSDGITMPVDPDATVPPTVPPVQNERFFATFDESQTPSLYVAGSTDMADDSVEVCVASKDQCAADESLWHRMKNYVSSGRTQQMFVSDGALPLDAQAVEQVFAIRGKTKADSTALQVLFKVLKQ